MTGVIPAWSLNEMLHQEPEEVSDYLFCYGILKRGFELDLRRYDAKFIDSAIIDYAKIYQIGSGVGLTLSQDGDDVVYGELFKIPYDLWTWLDRIEGHPYNYKREIKSIYYKSVVGYNEKAWVYIHQHPKCFGKRIKSGRYENADIRV